MISHQVRSVILTQMGLYQDNQQIHNPEGQTVFQKDIWILITRWTKSSRRLNLFLTFLSPNIGTEKQFSRERSKVQPPLPILTLLWSVTQTFPNGEVGRERQIKCSCRTLSTKSRKFRNSLMKEYSMESNQTNEQNSNIRSALRMLGSETRRSKSSSTRSTAKRISSRRRWWKWFFHK